MARRNRIGGPSALQHQQWSWVLGVMVGLQQKYGLGGVVEVDELVAQKRLAASSGAVLGLFVCLLFVCCFICLFVYLFILFVYLGLGEMRHHQNALRRCVWDPRRLAVGQHARWTRIRLSYPLKPPHAGATRPHPVKNSRRLESTSDRVS